MRFNSICGLDEAGRGALAGPLVGAIVLYEPKDIQKLEKTSLHIKDSKLLSLQQRESVYAFLLRKQIQFTTHTIDSKFINRHGIQKSNRLLFYALFKKIAASAYIVDGRWKRFYQKCAFSLIDADSFATPVILAGIVAKVVRDQHMQQLSIQSPEFGWSTNVGYGTRSHIEAIMKHGSTQQHRTQFVKTALTHFLSR